MPKLAEGQSEPYTVREATPDDVPFISDLDRQSRGRYFVTAARDDALWRYELDCRSQMRRF